MKTLKESLLDNIEKSLAANPASIMCPAPKVRDFKKAAFSGNYIDWECRPIIQNAIDILDSNLFPLLANARVNKDNLVGIRISIHSKYELNFYLIGEDGTYAGAIDLIDLPGFGTGGLSIPNIKKSVIEFFKYIESNPEKLKDVFEYANKRRYELTKNGVCDELTFERIFKY